MIPCIIPARGGSKGISRKNLVEVGGKPLIVWSIEQAMLCPSINKVIVATDSDQIAEVAEMHGAEIFRRSEQSATDTAPSEVVLCEVALGGFQDAEAIVFLQATSPIRQPDDIENAISEFRVTGADSLFSARVVDGYTWTFNGRMAAQCWGQRNPRQQEISKTLEENGSIYIFKPSVLMDYGNRLGGKIVHYMMHPLDSFQIDEPEDIPLIESLMELRLGSTEAIHTYGPMQTRYE